MTAIAHMPDAAVGNGTTDDTAALQAMFNACPSGGLCIIPNAVFRVTNTVQVPRPMNVWCEPGAHIKGDFSGTQAVVWAFWHTPDGTSDLYVAQDMAFWQGGTISRLSRNGPCLRLSAWWGGTVQNVRFLRGSPHLLMDAPDTVSGWYTGGFGPNFAAIARAAMCRGYDGGPLGCVVGQLPNFTASGQCNGMMVEYCYFQGNGASGSVGLKQINGGGQVYAFNTFDNYLTGVEFVRSTRMAGAFSNKAVGANNAYTSSGSGNTNDVALLDPRGWAVGSGSLSFAGRDPQGVY